MEKILKRQEKYWRRTCSTCFMKSLFPLVSLTVILAACSQTKNATMYTPSNFDIQAHRGGRGLMPENTIPAMLNALELGVNTLEMDVVITKDKQVILSHEPFFAPEITTLPNGKYIDSNAVSYNIYQMNYEEVKKYDVGLKPYPLFPKQKKIAAIKPLLSDVVAAVRSYMLTAKRTPVWYNIEIKSKAASDGVFHPEVKAYTDLVIDEIRKAGIESYTIIQSFDMRVLTYMHTKYPSFPTALLVEANSGSSFRKQMKDLGFTPSIYSPHYSLVTPALVAECHAMKMKIIPWTVNDAAKMQQLRKMGVDGFITDYPDIAK